tara:strand:- start:7028 stop:7210 length:183 start_codon:yes stop_codon:yes gene_type:complete
MATQLYSLNLKALITSSGLGERINPFLRQCATIVAEANKQTTATYDIVGSQESNLKTNEG